MQNLLQRIYLQPDLNLVGGENQQRLIITARELSHPFTEDPAAREQIKLFDYVKSLGEVAQRYATADEQPGRNDGLWAFLRSCDKRLVIIADEITAATLLIQLWKTIFRTHTPESLYSLYGYYIRNENLLSVQAVVHERNSPENPLTVDDVTLPVMDFEKFHEVYAATPATKGLEGLTKRELPIEYLLMNYFMVSTGLRAAKTEVGRIALDKVKHVVLTNCVAQLVGALPDFFDSTHNFYRLRPEGAPETDIVDTLAEIRANPDLSWVFDLRFRPNNLAYIEETYTLEQLQRFFDAYTKLFDFTYEEAFALEYIRKNDMVGLLEYDARDELGNFLGTEHYVKKINGLLISRIYQLHRQGKRDELRKYELA